MGKKIPYIDFETVSADNGAQALAPARATPPDLSISDILTPVIIRSVLPAGQLKYRVVRRHQAEAALTKRLVELMEAPFLQTAAMAPVPPLHYAPVVFP